MKKKILHILNTSSYSGAENVAISIINNMGDRYESAYASLEGPIRNNLKKNNIVFIPIVRMSISEIRRIIKLFKPDIIHAHDYTASIIVASSGVKIPIISHLHNNPPWLKNYNVYSYLYLLSTFRYKKVLGVSESIFEEYVFGKKISNKTMSISNPIDTEDIIKKKNCNSEFSASYDVVFLGRLTVQKNPIRFIRIISEMVIKVPDLQVAMIGDGILRKECDLMIDQLNLSKNIHLLGFLENPYEFLSKAKVLCITSKWEGFGLVAVEALSLGIPVIATPVGGLPGIVDSECGLLTNDNNEYAEELYQVLNNEEYRNKKSLKAYIKSGELNNINFYIEKLTDIYENC